MSESDDKTQIARLELLEARQRNLNYQTWTAPDAVQFFFNAMGAVTLLFGLLGAIWFIKEMIF
jgi:hypothetical protein